MLKIFYAAAIRRWKAYRNEDEHERPVVVVPSLPPPVPTPDLPPAPAATSGVLARLKWDDTRKEYHYQWRIRGRGKKATDKCPQTVTFNQVKRADKGSRVKISTLVQKYMEQVSVNPDARGWRTLLDPKTGWLNKITDPLTAEPLSFAGNDVLVIGQNGKYSKVSFIPHDTHAVNATFFSPNGRLYIHKATAGHYTKIGAGVDAYLPFVNQLGQEYWTLTERLEFFPALPFKLNTGKIVTEYLLLGDLTYGLTASSEVILLYSPSGQYQTNWKMTNRPVPPGAK